MTNWSFHIEEKLENSFGQPQSGKLNGSLRTLSEPAFQNSPLPGFLSPGSGPLTKGGEIPDAV